MLRNHLGGVTARAEVFLRCIGRVQVVIPEYSAAHQKSHDLAEEMGPVPTCCNTNCNTQIMIIPTYYACHVYYFTFKCKTHQQD